MSTLHTMDLNFLFFSITKIQELCSSWDALQNHCLEEIPSENISSSPVDKVPSKVISGPVSSITSGTLGLQSFKAYKIPTDTLLCHFSMAQVI